MWSLRKLFQKRRRVFNETPALAPFNVEAFIDLIVLKQAGRTTWKQNRWIRRQVLENPEATQAWRDAMETWPLEHFSLQKEHPPLMKMAAMFLVVTLLALGLYALSRYYNISVDVHIEKKQMYHTRFNHTRLAEVAKVIEYNYAKKVVFDRQTTADKMLNGNIDTTRRVEEFLEELRLNGVDNYIDDKGLIHIK